MDEMIFRFSFGSKNIYKQQKNTFGLFTYFL